MQEDFGLGKNFFRHNKKKITILKGKIIDQLDFHQKLLLFKDIKKMKRQATEWEKILANHVSDKGLEDIQRTHAIH